MPRYLTIVYDTSGWTADQVKEVCSDESARVLSWSHAIHDRDYYKNQIDSIQRDELVKSTDIEGDR